MSATPTPRLQASPRLSSDVREGEGTHTPPTAGASARESEADADVEAEAAPRFNEQTNYVPRAQIIKVSNPPIVSAQEAGADASQALGRSSSRSQRAPSALCWTRRRWPWRCLPFPPSLALAHRAHGSLPLTFCEWVCECAGKRGLSWADACDCGL